MLLPSKLWADLRYGSDTYSNRARYKFFFAEINRRLALLDKNAYVKWLPDRSIPFVLSHAYPKETCIVSLCKYLALVGDVLAEMDMEVSDATV